MTKKYAAGMYGGKFMPMHKGHLSCVQKASELCDHVYLILFYGGRDEAKVNAEFHQDFLSLENRWEQVRRAAAMFDNVEPLIVDVSSCFYENGEENWDMETPLVLDACGHFDAVFGSEPSYKAYFDRAYPWADYIMVDPDREILPISATKIRNMKSKEEIEKWII